MVADMSFEHLHDQTNARCGPVPSKTQSYDDTIDLRNQIYSRITKVAAVLAAGRPSERIFEYRC